MVSNIQPMDGNSDMADTIDFHSELSDTKKAIKEIELMLEQSKIESGRLSQRNAAISAHLQQIQNQMDNSSKEEIKSAYVSAMEAQQRLFIMRGQLEKLQSDHTHLDRYRSILEHIINVESQGSNEPKENNISASLEMLVNIQEAERQRLSRQMHDGPAQALSNFILQSEIAMKFLEIDPEMAREELVVLKSSAMSTFQKVRNFIFELRPMMLDDLGMIPTLKRYVSMVGERTGIDINLTVTGMEKRLEQYIEVMLFRSTQEFIGNSERHGKATSIKILLDISDDSVKLSVDDNGKGFDVDNYSEDSSLNLRIIRDRVEMLGGKLLLDSTLGKGTKVSLSIPIE
jgi:two-component system, NarL family, sensor histidine kinase DegS